MPLAAGVAITLTATSRPRRGSRAWYTVPIPPDPRSPRISYGPSRSDTLPPDELLAKLQALTNLRVVEEATAPTGYKLEVAPFPGWKDVPTW